MSTDIQNTDGDLVYRYLPFVTLIGPDTGQSPEDEDEQEDLRCVRVVQSAGGKRLDYAQHTWRLTELLSNRDQPSSFRRAIAVLMPTAERERIHWGDYTSETEAITQDGDTLSATSQLRPYHFGRPVVGYPVYNPLTDAEEIIDADIPFNPTIDGTSRFNMSSETRDGLTSRLFLHPESAYTTTAAAYHDTTVGEWTIKTAVQAMCELLNKLEPTINNPTEAELALLNSAPLLRDVKLSAGWYLPQCLDRLLIPFGFSWFVDYETTPGNPKIVVFEIGVGDEKELKLQEPYEALNLTESNVNQLQVERGIGDSFNRVVVRGDYEEYEVTLPLVPGWPAAADSKTSTDLDKTDDDSDYVGNELAWRQWVANESGDIDEARSFGAESFDVPDLTGLFAKYVPHRRNIYEPLSYAGGSGSKERRPVFVEYSTDAGVTWEVVPENWPMKLLPDQIGILFDGDMPPEELNDAGTSARMRITGTVRGDSRIEGIAEREDFAVNRQTFTMIIEAGDKFVFRKRATSGAYSSVLNVGSNASAEQDDTTDIETYAEEIRDKNHHAEVDAEFRLPGWHLEYKIGDLITKIAGREINLDAAGSDSPEPRYPQIVERRFEYDLKGPFTVLIVDRGTESEERTRPETTTPTNYGDPFAPEGRSSATA
jgi:hypothetical protein